jgi:hypothetical protein
MASGTRNSSRRISPGWTGASGSPVIVLLSMIIRDLDTMREGKKIVSCGDTSRSG